MWIEKLRLSNWRNYRETEIVFDPGINLICGDNAQGKTNLLEAVSYLGLASSFRGSADTDLINKESDFFYLKADLYREDMGNISVSAAMDKRGKRKWQINGEPRRRLADIIGICHSVIFSPDDIYLIKGGPDKRRRWLNRQLAQNDTFYCRDMLSYNKILRQRNALLKAWSGNPQPDILAAYDEQLVLYGSRVIYARNQACSQLQQLAADIHQGLSGGEELEIIYKSQLISKDSENTLEEIGSFYKKRLADHETAEQIRGITLVGPHRDEIGLNINKAAAKDFASQGQQRTLAVSLKLAELEWARMIKGEYPILLLDDVLSELDEDRKRRILDLPEHTQIFITAAGRDFGGLKGKQWLVEAENNIAAIKQLKDR